MREMPRLLASAMAAALLLSSGLDAVVLAKDYQEPCAGHCGCNEDPSEGPALERVCCCAVEPNDTPEPQPLPTFLGSAEDVPPMPPQAVLETAPFAVQSAAVPRGLRPLPPRAPPAARLRLASVLRC